MNERVYVKISCMASASDHAEYAHGLIFLNAHRANAFLRGDEKVVWAIVPSSIVYRDDYGVVRLSENVREWCDLTDGDFHAFRMEESLAQ